VGISRTMQSVNARATRAQTAARKNRSVKHTAWTEHIPDEEWKIYDEAIRAVRQTGCRFMLAGAFSLASYTGRWRNTKDIDFYILPQERQRFVEALTRAGFVDYFRTLPYDRNWIYRSIKGDCIVDVIWAMANQRAQVDEEWFEHAPEIQVRGQTLRVAPAEELLWCKLFVLQRERCDWPDVLNLIHSLGADLDWEHLLNRLGDDLPLLAGLLNVYGWLCPGNDLLLPASLRELVPHSGRRGAPVEDATNIRLLDSRPWFIGGAPHTEGIQPCSSVP
jgi:hypothetical protein